MLKETFDFPDAAERSHFQETVMLPVDSEVDNAVAALNDPHSDGASILSAIRKVCENFLCSVLCGIDLSWAAS